MLEKTLAMLAEVRPGTYLPDDIECYDPAELDAFGRVLNRLLYSPSSLRRLLQQNGQRVGVAHTILGAILH